MQLEPTDIKVNVEQQRLLLSWEDGQYRDFSHAELREHCPCGFCRSTRLREKDIQYPEDVQISAIYAQGYGIQICFNDGHDKGIFPWAFLRELAV